MYIYIYVYINIYIYMYLLRIENVHEYRILSAQWPGHLGHDLLCSGLLCSAPGARPLCPRHLGPCCALLCSALLCYSFSIFPIPFCKSIFCTLNSNTNRFLNYYIFVFVYLYTSKCFIYSLLYLLYIISFHISINFQK